MNPKHLAVFLAAFVVLASGCLFQPGQQDPKLLFKELSEKGEQKPDGKYSYIVGFDFSEDAFSDNYFLQSLLSGLEYDIEIYKSGGKEKKLLTTSLLGLDSTTRVYDLEGDKYKCVDFLSLTGEATGVSCYVVESASINSLLGVPDTESAEEIISETDVSLKGVEEVNGRDCYIFDMGFSPEQVSKMLENQTDDDELELQGYFDGMSMEMEIGLDKQHGFECSSHLVLKKEGEKEAFVEMNLVLEEFSSGKIADEEFELPEDPSEIYNPELQSLINERREEFLSDLSEYLLDSNIYLDPNLNIYNSPLNVSDFGGDFEAYADYCETIPLSSYIELLEKAKESDNPELLLDIDNDVAKCASIMQTYYIHPDSLD